MLFSLSAATMKAGLLLVLTTVVVSVGASSDAVQQQEHYDGNPFYCTLQHSHDAGHCINHKGCYWCQGGSLHGICVAKDQAEAFIDKIPGVKCEHESPTCLKAGMEAPQAEKEHACNSAVSADGGTPCVWCHGGGIVGLCLSSEQASAASTYLECGGAVAQTEDDETNEDAVDYENPLDPTCAQAGYDAPGDAVSTCHDTSDQDGKQCLWCAVDDTMGVCVNSDQANIMRQYLTCDGEHNSISGSATEEEENVQNPYDITCAIAGYTAGTGGESACKTTQDQDGDTCVWCTYGGQGLCLTDEQASIADQMQFQCEESVDIPQVEAQNPYDVTCAIAGYTAGTSGESVCKTTQDQDGDTCVWCTYGGQGLCLTDEQASIADQMQFQCEESADIPQLEETNPYDVTCAIAGYTAGTGGESVCKTTQDQDGDTCVWCTSGGQGLCLTDEQASIADQMQFQCEESADIPQLEETNPYDVTCAIAGYTAGTGGESVCKTTQDQDGDTCVWCTYGGQGLCLTDEQASIADQMQFQCEESADIPQLDENNPYDITCAIAGYTAGTGGESVCKTTQDQDGDTCVWCTYGGQGLCLTDEQASIADQMQFQCEERAAIPQLDETSPYDITCAIAGYTAGTGGESLCKTTQDQDGDTCVWCTYGGQGLCLTDEQAAIADQMQFQCEESVDVPHVEAQNPYDITCAVAGYTGGTGGESVCKTTQDQDGDTCVWCTYGGQGLCLTDEQASIADQMQFQCEESAGVPQIDETNPYDITCAIAGYTAGAGGESVCKTTQDQDGDTCVWCTHGGMGLCLTDEQASIADQMQFQCEERAEIPPLEERNPYDITCAVVGYTAGTDGESVCKTTQDQGGDTCVWCTYGGQGLCLTDEQASIADQMQFQCEEDTSVGSSSSKGLLEELAGSMM